MTLKSGSNSVRSLSLWKKNRDNEQIWNGNAVWQKNPELVDADEETINHTINLQHGSTKERFPET